MFKERKGSISGATAGNVLPQLMSMIRVFRAMTTRCIHRRIRVRPLTYVRFRYVLSRFLAESRLFNRHVQVNRRTGPLFSFLRTARRFYARCFIYHVLLPMLSNTTRQEEGGRCLLYPRCLHRVVVRVANFLRVTRGRGRQADDPLGRCEQGREDNENVWASTV